MNAPVPSPAAHTDARRWLGRATPEAEAGFCARQGAALARIAALEQFYAEHDCRMARLHRLASTVVVLHRFPGLSPAFDRIGALIQPVDADGPRGARWQAYARACTAGRALEVRDELWIAAHAEDLRVVRAEGLEAAFEAETVVDPAAWRLMRRHLTYTLGARTRDDDALSGAIALETAMAAAMSTSVARMLQDGGATVLRTVWLGLRSIRERSPPAPGLPSYRTVTRWLIASAWASLTTVGVWRRGQRELGRGAAAPGEGWPMLEQVLGDRVREVHPAVVAFYSDPARYDVQCTLDLYTTPAAFWSRLLTLTVGQGLYEAGSGVFSARIRTYRREDGSMHFVREIDTGRALRVFDSDFVVRDHQGVPTLFEHFPDEHIDVQLEVTPLGPGLGVSVRGVDVYWRGLRLPSSGLEIEFRSSVEAGALHVEGQLSMRPRTALGRFLAWRMLRRPEKLGTIRYVAVPRVAGPEDGPWPFLA